MPVEGIVQMVYWEGPSREPARRVYASGLEQVIRVREVMLVKVTKQK